MRLWTAFVSGILACCALCACSGEGEPCKSKGVFGPLYCDGGLICNGAAGNVCEPAMSRQEGSPCDANALCATSLWCDESAQKCRPWLREGDACRNPFSCGPSLACLKRASNLACGPQPVVDGLPQPSVIGTLTLPGSAQAKGTVAIYGNTEQGSMPITSGVISSSGSSSVDYRLFPVPAGSYFLFAMLDVDRSDGTLTPGDYSGWFGHNGDGNPPAAANVVLPESGIVRVDFSLVLQ